jgi:hypothetical protein
MLGLRALAVSARLSASHVNLDLLSCVPASLASGECTPYAYGPQERQLPDGNEGRQAVDGFQG